MRKEWHERLAALPAGLSLGAMAERLGQPYASVAFWAKLLKYDFVRQRRGRKSSIDWNQVDWSLRNCDIARQLGVTGERVRQIRLARHIPPTPRLSEAGRQFRDFLLLQNGRCEAMSLREMIARSGARLAVGTAHAILKQFRDQERG